MTEFFSNNKLRFLVQTSCCTVLLMTLVCMQGCTSKVDPQLASHHTRLAIAKEPAEATTIADAKTSITENTTVTVSGRADLTALAAGNKGKAVMMVREILANDHVHGTAKEASSCAFCRRRLENAPKAAVEFVDSAGKSLPYAVEQLFEIKDGDLVVVRGKATLDEGIDMLKIKANGLYIKSD